MCTAAGEAIGHGWMTGYNELMPGIGAGIVNKMVRDKVVNR